MSLIFYYTPVSSSTRVHWALEELGVPYEKVRMNLQAGDQRKPEYLALNPNGKVPLLVVDGQPLFESMAQLIWLGETYGADKGLFPKGGADKLTALQWIAWSTATLWDSWRGVYRNTAERFPAEQKNALAAEAARKEIAGHLAILNKHLDGKDYMLGGSFSLVDVALATFAAFVARQGIDLGPVPNVAKWVGRCMARPAFQRVMAA